MRLSFVLVAAPAVSLLVLSPVFAQTPAAPAPATQTPAPAPQIPAPAPATQTPAPAAANIVPPRLASSASVDYPDGAEGGAVVVLKLTIGADGAVRAASVIRGEEPFATAAASAAAGWRFEHATRAGLPIAAIILFEVTFTSKAPSPEPASPSEAPVSAAPPVLASPPPAPMPAAPIEVVVRGERPPPGVSSFTRAEIRQLPGAFGDPFRAIEVLPGVTPVVSGLPFFYVRGAPPGNVGYFLDGVRVPYLFHVGVGPSVIHPAMVEQVDLYPGGYPARFGRFAGGIVAGEATAPRSDLHAEGNVRLFDAGAMAETGFDGRRGTLLLGARYSYTGALFSLLSPDIDMGYRDYQARVTYDVTPRDRLTAFSFGSYDLVSQTQNGIESVLFGSEFYRLDMRYDHSFGASSTLRTSVTLGYDQSRIGEQRNARDLMLAVKTEVHHPLGDRVVLRTGTDFTIDALSADQARYADPDDPDTKVFNDTFPPRDDLATGAWVDLEMTVAPAVTVTPGVRVDVFASGGAAGAGVDPRISARLEVSDHVRILHAYGLAHQPPSFIVPVPGLSPGKLQGGLQTSLQTSAGVEVDLPEATTATATVFHNAFFDMTDALGVSGNRDPLDATADQRARGSALGFELFVRRRLTRQLGGFLSYTLSRSTRTVGADVFPSAFDRTHVANAALAYDLGRNWRAGTRVTLYTGTPKVTSSRGLIAPPPSLSPERNPLFYRVDLRLEKRWNFADRRWLSFVAEVMNVTLSKETFGNQEIGPITIPSLGLEGGL